MSRFAVTLVALSLLAPGAAWAKQGKAGLWRVTSTVAMQMVLPPELQARAQAMPALKPQTNVSQMCMTQAEVDASAPPHIDNAATGCETRLVSRSGSAMKAAMTCNGRMKGTGEMQIAYTGDTRYAGQYSFKGVVEGNPVSMTTQFKGEWQKADCGAVKPYQLRR